MAIVILIAIILALLLWVLPTNFSPFDAVRNFLRQDPGIQGITVEVQEDIIRDIFQVATLEIESSNTSVLEIVPGGFINPGVVAFILEYDSTVVFGVRDASQIQMRRVGDFVFVRESSINIEITSVSVRNFRRVGTFRTNPLVRINESVIDQIFVAQQSYEETAAQRLDNAQNIETARRNFMSTLEAVCRGLGLTVIWE